VPNSLNSRSTPAELFIKKKSLKKIKKILKKGCQTPWIQLFSALFFLNFFRLNQLQNGPTRNDILSSDSENEAEAVTKNAQTSREQVWRPSSNATRLSYLASLAPEERERHLVDFHVTYARANKPPAKKKLH